MALVLALLGVLCAPHAAWAQGKPDAATRKKAAAHFKQGRAYFDAGAYDNAVAEYLEAYRLVPANALLFNIARAYHLGAKKLEAVDYYARYLEAEPDGEAADEAREFRAVLTRELADEEAERKRRDEAAAAEEQRKRDEQAAAEEQRKRDEAARLPPVKDPSPPRPGLPGPKRPAEKRSGVEWGWVGVGGALLVAGGIADVVPDSTHNQTFEGTDLLGLGLYVLGVTVIGVGVF